MFLKIFVMYLLAILAGLAPFLRAEVLGSDALPLSMVLGALVFVAVSFVGPRFSALPEMRVMAGMVLFCSYFCFEYARGISVAPVPFTWKLWACLGGFTLFFFFGVFAMRPDMKGKGLVPWVASVLLMLPGVAMLSAGIGAFIEWRRRRAAEALPREASAG